MCVCMHVCVLSVLSVCVYCDALIGHVVQEEVEIRAATVVCTAAICKTLNDDAAGAGGRAVMDVEVDWLLWQDGERRKDELPPHHRTLTCFY